MAHTPDRHHHRRPKNDAGFKWFRPHTWPDAHRPQIQKRCDSGCNKRNARAGITVIDDEDDELDELPLFQPSDSTGLTMEIVRGVERYLNGKTNETMRSNVIERIGQNIQSVFKRDKS
jgi:hypothetical protein